MAQNSQKIDSLTNQAIAGQVSSSSSEVDEMILQCQREASDSIQKLEAQAASADSVPEKMRCNLRVKALKILMTRLEGACGKKVDAMPSDEEVEWARKLFGLKQ